MATDSKPMDLIDLTMSHDTKTAFNVTPNVGLCNLTMTTEINPAVVVTPGHVGILATDPGDCNRVLLGKHHCDDSNADIRDSKEKKKTRREELQR